MSGRRRSGLGVYRALLGAVAVGSIALAGPVPVAAASGTCDYDPVSHKVTVSLSGESNFLLFRTPAGQIYFGNSWCDSAATVTNTDTVQVDGDSSSQGIIIEIGGGGMKPGFTNEAGKSDEIEFTVNLGGGGADEVTILGDDGANKIVLGQDNSQLVMVRRINLNAGESTGVDADVSMTGVERVTVLGYAGKDVIRARGKAGTGPNALTLPLIVHGGPGADVIKGGDAADILYGEPGKDKIWGYGGADSIYMQDGQGGDVGYGGAGTDTVTKDAGDTWKT